MAKAATDLSSSRESMVRQGGYVYIGKTESQRYTVFYQLLIEGGDESAHVTNMYEVHLNHDWTA